MCVGLGPFAGWRIARIMQKDSLGIPVQASCHLDWSGPESVLEGITCLLWCAVVWRVVLACLWLSGGLSSHVETSFGYLHEGHGYSCALGFKNSHHVDIRSTAQKLHCVNNI